jgi:hypothetical protein
MIRDTKLSIIIQPPGIYTTLLVNSEIMVGTTAHYAAFAPRTGKHSMLFHRKASWDGQLKFYELVDFISAFGPLEPLALLP